MPLRHRVLPLLRVLFCLALPSVQAAEPGVREWREFNERASVAQYLDYLGMPNVARGDADISANARWLQQTLEQRGFAVLLSDDRDAPVVFAEYRAPQAQGTLLLYIHYDGQPVTASEWTWCPPFEPCLVGPDGVIDLDEVEGPLDPQWRLYARSASDDKAPLGSLLGAFDALSALGDLHSGNYGNWAPDPSFRLAHLLSSMKAADGRVLIDGFYAQVTPLTAQEEAALAAMTTTSTDRTKTCCWATYGSA